MSKKLRSEVEKDFQNEIFPKKKFPKFLWGHRVQIRQPDQTSFLKFSMVFKDSSCAAIVRLGTEIVFMNIIP